MQHTFEISLVTHEKCALLLVLGYLTPNMFGIIFIFLFFQSPLTLNQTVFDMMLLILFSFSKNKNKYFARTGNPNQIVKPPFLFH
jgi:hypothetical protein